MALSPLARPSRAAVLALFCALPGCDDYLWNAPAGVEIGDATGWCAVEAVIASRCASCHASAAPAGGLDLATDPHAALVGVSSAQYPTDILVVAGDPAASLFYLKVTVPPADRGGKMPPSGALSAAEIDAIAAWITDGAPADCDESFDPERYHPDDWALPEAHGIGAKLHQDDCLACHGEDLTGGVTGVSCDTCHVLTVPEWRTTCTFCHGDPDDGTGAPPEDIDDVIAPDDISFPAHGVHVAATIHPAWDCTTCHVKPTSATSPGHLFDATAGRAEVTFGELSLALGATPTYSAATGTCSDVYCHGTGRDPGSVSSGAFETSCDGCHPDAGSGEDRWDAMSGEHSEHLDEGAVCADCHLGVVSRTQEIVAPTLHVNGVKNVWLAPGMTFDAADTSCTGSCHLDGDEEDHDSEDW